MNCAAALRAELAFRAQRFAVERYIPHSISSGTPPVVCFPAYGEDVHGNFHPASFKSLQARPEWRGRLQKVHTSARQILPRVAGMRWKELDSCMSSDALLMNIFCHPGIRRRVQLSKILAIEWHSLPQYGFRARVPLLNGRFDRTEVDMKLHDVMIEAKLTESNFQRAKKSCLDDYRDFRDVFDRQQLRQDETHYYSYQLIRNVLAAHASQCSFCVLLDARRPDLIEECYAAFKCVQPFELRTRCKLLTWQELSAVLPSTLREFLAVKYGICQPHV